jgi:AAA+ superfamily predicted ATPase
VLKHREDDILPIEYLKEELRKDAACKIEDSTLTALFLLIKNSGKLYNDPAEQIEQIFHKKYPDDDVSEVIDITLEECEDEQSKADAGKSAGSTISPPPKVNFDSEGRRIDGSKSDDSKSDDGAQSERSRTQDVIDRLTGAKAKKEGKGDAEDVDTVLAKINSLVGCVQFKALANEVVQIAPQIKANNTSDIFAFQSYLFSIGDGCGLSTYLQLFVQLIGALGINKIAPNPVTEVRLDAYKESLEPFEDAIRVLKSGNENYVRILCIDISEWMSKTDNRYFKQFLRVVEKYTDKFIVVFRVPYVDMEVLSRLQYSLSDLLYIRTVAFPPLNQSEIKSCAEAEIGKYGFTVSKAAWDIFQHRISEEKSDGKFYGLNTVKKVVKELVYKKQLHNARSGKADNQISKNDMKELCASAHTSGVSGYEQLNSLIGNENIKKQIDEIVAQIKLSLKNDSVSRPCIHMRFVGNPGTGKTTVARILGKILKENGVLRVGNFYEYAGRDLCGRYIGETAPKTASICRDAYGSVLFIDEAYSLYRGDGNDRDYGREALDTLIAEMENHRNDLVVIMAGYTDDINKMMEGNLGLASRMPYTLEFPNFTRQELFEIFKSMVQSKFKYEEELMDTAQKYFENLSDNLLSAKEFSNARFVRNLFERTWAKAAMRCQLNNSADVILTKDDFERASSDKEFAYTVPKKPLIGF